MLRSRIVQTLNVPHRERTAVAVRGGRVRKLRLGPSLAAALLDELFEHPARYSPAHLARLAFLAVLRISCSIQLANLVWGRTSFEHGLNILQTDQSHLNPRVHGGGAQMREQHHLLQLSQR